MFSKGSLSSISLATVTPSTETIGAPHFFSRSTARPRGPRVTLTARASCLTPRRIASRASWSNAILFAVIGSLQKSPSSRQQFAEAEKTLGAAGLRSLGSGEVLHRVLHAEAAGAGQVDRRETGLKSVDPRFEEIPGRRPQEELSVGLH